MNIPENFQKLVAALITVFTTILVKLGVDEDAIARFEEKYPAWVEDAEDALTK